jgi:hypothetical protein
LLVLMLVLLLVLVLMLVVVVVVLLLLPLLLSLSILCLGQRRGPIRRHHYQAPNTAIPAAAQSSSTLVPCPYIHRVSMNPPQEAIHHAKRYEAASINHTHFLFVCLQYLRKCHVGSTCAVQSYQILSAREQPARCACFSGFSSLPWSSFLPHLLPHHPSTSSHRSSSSNAS